MNSTSRSSSALLLLALGCAPPPLAGRNLVVISIDTMRADRLGRLGADGQSLTPALDAFSATALAFSQAFSPSNETLFSHAGIFLGEAPSAWGPLDYGTFRLRPDAPTLASHLAQAGWRTEAVVAGGHMAPVFGIDAGFQRYQTTPHPFSSFQSTVPAALERLDALATGDRPFFLFVHGYDCHSPYIKPGPLHHIETPGYSGRLINEAENPLFWERLTAEAFFPQFFPPPLQAGGAAFLNPAMFSALSAHAADPAQPRFPLEAADHAFIQGVYDSAVAYADTQVGRVLARVDEPDLAENTVVVVLSDHGEDLLAHGAMNHRISLHDENTHVPLLIRTPGAAAGRVEGLVQLQDLAPALLAAVGAASGPALTGLVRDAVYSESLLGERSLRTAEGRLRTPAAALSGPRPAVAEAGMELLDGQGRPLPWADPLGDRLWTALSGVKP